MVISIAVVTSIVDVIIITFSVTVIVVISVIRQYVISVTIASINTIMIIIHRTTVINVVISVMCYRLSGNDTDGNIAKDASTGGGATPNTVWNAAGLQTGVTEVLVAPGLRTPQEQAKPDPASCSNADQHKVPSEEEGAAGDFANGTHSQTLELHLEGDSEAGAEAGESHLPVPSEAEEEQAAPDMGLLNEAGEEEEGVAADAAEGVEADMDVQSMLSDGADSYQGLPAESLAHLAASANEDIPDLSEEAEWGTATAGQSEALDNACEEQGMEEDEQQLPQEVLEPSTSAQTETLGEAGQDSNMLGAKLQHADTVTEAQDNHQVQTAVDRPAPDHKEVDMAGEGLALETAGTSENSAAAHASSITGAIGWQAGMCVEVHCSSAPQAWSWRSGTLGSAHLPGAASQALVQWKSAPSATSSLSELIEPARLRPVPPSETQIAEIDMPSRGSVVEVDCGDGSYKTHIRRPTQYSPEQQSFEDLADEQTSALLESWGFARTAAAASE
ncbi:hypothetical protein MMC16_007779 [Acarospora aff. strigata]|nr:hypothetical protein [Acarospora aff. strigata]